MKKDSVRSFVTTHACKHVVLSALLLSAFLIGSPLSTNADILSTQAVQQNGIVKGKVVDHNGEPIIGAAVKVMGTDRGTVTNLDGEFTLEGVNTGKLNISYVGFGTKEVSFRAGETLSASAQSRQRAASSSKCNLLSIFSMLNGFGCEYLYNINNFSF